MFPPSKVFCYTILSYILQLMKAFVIGAPRSWLYMISSNPLGQSPILSSCLPSQLFKLTADHRASNQTIINIIVTVSLAKMHTELSTINIPANNQLGQYCKPSILNVSRVTFVKNSINCLCCPSFKTVEIIQFHSCTHPI